MTDCVSATQPESECIQDTEMGIEKKITMNWNEKSISDVQNRNGDSEARDGAQGQFPAPPALRACQHLQNALDVLPLHVVTLYTLLDAVWVADELQQLLGLHIGEHRVKDEFFVCAQALGFSEAVLSHPLLQWEWQLVCRDGA